jgi:hypothetical protein
MKPGNRERGGDSVGDKPPVILDKDLSLVDVWEEGKDHREIAEPEADYEVAWFFDLPSPPQKSNVQKP